MAWKVLDDYLFCCMQCGNMLCLCSHEPNMYVRAYMDGSIKVSALQPLSHSHNSPDRDSLRKAPKCRAWESDSHQSAGPFYMTTLAPESVLVAADSPTGHAASSNCGGTEGP
jgi:hypothetical protein